MQKVFGACLAVLTGITASGALAQTAYPPASDYGGGAPTLLLPDGWNEPNNSGDGGYGSSEASPEDVGAPDGAPAEEGSGEQDAEDGH